MEIRYARPDEVPELVVLGARMHAESPRYEGIPFSAEKAANTARGVIASNKGAVLVAVKEGQIVGMLVGMVVEHFFSYANYACDFVVYVLPRHRGGSAAVRLIKKWDELLATAGVEDSTLGISTEVAPERTRKLYEKLGYKLSGYLMRKSYVRS